jgi:putative PIN family toxin of toxin-antitoxin system
MIVLDTNIVLDLLVFDDRLSGPLMAALQSRQLQWIATPAMREELARVLAYPQIVPRLAHAGRECADVLAVFDAHVRLCDVAPKSAFTCKDPDDQKFIDLAVTHRAQLLSKDHAVLRMKKRLATLGVTVDRAMALPG